MNLVSKEYVACQRRGEGVLVLSEFAGAAAEMGEAFLVNPYDEERVAAVLERVLDLPAEERKERMVMLHRRVLRNTVFRWSERFLSLLDEARAGPAGRASGAAGRAAGGRPLWIRSAPRAAASSSSTTTAPSSPSRRGPRDAVPAAARRRPRRAPGRRARRHRRHRVRPLARRPRRACSATCRTCG